MAYGAQFTNKQTGQSYGHGFAAHNATNPQMGQQPGSAPAPNSPAALKAELKKTREEGIYNPLQTQTNLYNSRPYQNLTNMFMGRATGAQAPFSQQMTNQRVGEAQSAVNRSRDMMQQAIREQMSRSGIGGGLLTSAQNDQQRLAAQKSRDARHKVTTSDRLANFNAERAGQLDTADWFTRKAAHQMGGTQALAAYKAKEYFNTPGDSYPGMGQGMGGGGGRQPGQPRPRPQMGATLTYPKNNPPGGQQPGAQPQPNPNPQPQPQPQPQPNPGFPPVPPQPQPTPQPGAPQGRPGQQGPQGAPPRTGAPPPVMGPDGQWYSPHPEVGGYEPHDWRNWENLLPQAAPPDSLTLPQGMYYPEAPQSGQGQAPPGQGYGNPNWGQPAFDPAPRYEPWAQPQPLPKEQTGSLDYWIGQQLPTQSGYQQGPLPDLPSQLGQNPPIFL